ncbi:hypothetical protein EI94DRAFT_1708314 [Lactarius quietus]|nr:hypothetical protein EI94DRAFT_1708314 [Lactarius quietus]
MSPPSSLLLYYHAPFPKKYNLTLSSASTLSRSICSRKRPFARTQSGIGRLRLLREKAAANMDDLFNSFDEKIFDNVIHFDHQPDIAAEVQDKIDWGPFNGQAQYARSQPSATQQTALSSAQQLVRNARWSIIEPVLASFELSSDSSDAEQLAPESLHPVRERKQLRRIHLRNTGGLTLRASGVQIHRDIGDESADVDIAMTDGDPLAVASTPGASTSVPSAEPFKQTHIKTHSHVQRIPVGPRRLKVSEPDKCPPVLPPPATKEKPKSETYKQAWLISKQQLLERLLAEIPDGEKNRQEIPFPATTQMFIFVLQRWSKISKADVLRVQAQGSYKRTLKN